MRKSIKNISILLFCGVMSFTAMQTKAQPDLVSQIFNDIKNRVIDGADKLQEWKNAATSAATKKATDFTDCPSPAAQDLYNDLTEKKRQAVAVYDLAHQADLDAQKARDDCKSKTHLDAACNTAYTNLTFQATANTANGVITSMNAALGVLKALKCPQGCNRTARIVYPTIEFGEKRIGNLQKSSPLPIIYPSSTGRAIITNAAPIALVNDITYCSAWKSGSFWANWDSGNGEFGGGFQAKLPQCAKTNTISVCSDYDLELLLPKLQKLSLVPPDVSVSDLQVSIPNKDVTVFTGVNQATCNRPIKIAKSASVTLNFDLSTNPLSILTGQGGEMVEIGCAEPAFGLAPVSSNVSIPDLTKVKISWAGLKVKGGSIQVDMTKPEFKGTCKKGCPYDLKAPTVDNIGKGYLDLPSVCLEPRLVDLVTNK